MWSFFEHNKQKFLFMDFMNGLGHFKSDNIKWMITLSVITISGFFCTYVCRIDWNPKVVSHVVLVCKM